MIPSHAIKSMLLLFLTVVMQAESWSPRPPIYSFAASDGKVHKSLYPQDGPVKVFIGSDFDDAKKKDPNAIWLVEYYDINCPHCWVFSAIYPLIAKAIGSANVKVAAFNCVDFDNVGACGYAGVVKYPTVLLSNAQKPGDVHPVHVHTPDDLMDPLPAKTIAANLVKYSGGKITIVNSAVLDSGANFRGGKAGGVAPSGPPGKPGWDREGYATVQVRFHDAHVGMAQFLMDGYVNSGKYQAALDVVDFVGRAFSKDEAAVFADLKAKLTAKPNLEPIEFKQIMTAWVQKFTDRYIFCKDQTCAVWQLLHGITLLVAIKYTPIAITEALTKFRFMVNEFLSCDACRHHFVESYDRCLFGRCEVLTAGDEAAQAKAMVLWLWRTHNAVSVRVLSANTHNSPYDRRWPQYKDCPGCWKQSVVSGTSGKLLTFPGQKDMSGKLGTCFDIFDEDKVFGFMMFTYLGEEQKAQVKAIFGDIPFFEDRRSTPRYSFVAAACAVSAIAVGVMLLVAVRRYSHPDQEISRTFKAIGVEEEMPVHAEGLFDDAPLVE